MLGAGFAEAGATAGPVFRVLLIVAVLALVIAAVVFLGPMERFVNRLAWWRKSADAQTITTNPAAGVLWVDDRPEHNARLLDGLRDQGVRVDVARTTDEALELLGERTYAIIVADVSRAEQPDNGVSLLEQASGAVPVVIFSRYTSTADAYRDSALPVVSSEAEIENWLRSVDLLP